MSSYLMRYSILHELNTLDAGRSRSLCGVIVVDTGRVDLLDMNVMPIFMIIALYIVITLRFSINCSAVICSLNVIFSILREASSETYGPGSTFHHISFRSTMLVSYLLPLQSFTFRSINQKTPKYLLYLLFSFIYLYQISLLQVTVKGLTTPFIALVASV